MPLECASDRFETGRALIGRWFRVERVHYAPGYRRTPHAHDTTGITLVLDGHFRERVAKTEEDASALSVVFKPAGTLHENAVGPGGATTIAVAITDATALPGEDLHPGLWRWIHAGAGVQPLLALARALVDPSSAPDPEEMVLELLGEVVDEAPAPRAGAAPAWIRRAREALDDLAPEGIEVRALAESLGVHPVSLTRAFRRAYGISVARYRRQVRLRKAAQQVAGTGHTLSEIAHAAGYADHPHMCREIRSATGLTPASFRELRLRLGRTV